MTRFLITAITIIMVYTVHAYEIKETNETNIMKLIPIGNTKVFCGTYIIQYHLELDSLLDARERILESIQLIDQICDRVKFTQSVQIIHIT